MRFRLLSGHHNQGETDASGKAIMYEPGDVLDSAVDLCKRCNTPMFPPKFERVSSATPLYRKALDVPPPSYEDTNDGLESLNVAELRQFAADEGIELGAAKTKDDLIALIRSKSPALAQEQ